MKFKIILLAICVAFTSVGCARVKAKALERLLEQSGDKYKIAKLFTEKDGYVVYLNQTTGEYVAYNISKFNKKEMKSLSQYMAVATDVNDIVHNLAQKSETRTEYIHHDGYWVDDENPVYDYDGNIIGYTHDSYYVEPWTEENTYTYTWYEGAGFRFSEGSAQTKDLEGIAAAAEDESTQAVTDSIVSKFGLSEERAETLANLAVNYSKLSESRSLTDADKEVFAKQALDVSYADLEKAYKKSATGAGDQDYNSLISKAAKANGTSPEKARALMSMYFGSQE